MKPKNLMDGELFRVVKLSVGSIKRWRGRGFGGRDKLTNARERERERECKRSDTDSRLCSVVYVIGITAFPARSGAHPLLHGCLSDRCNFSWLAARARLDVGRAKTGNNCRIVHDSGVKMADKCHFWGGHCEVDGGDPGNLEKVST